MPYHIAIAVQAETIEPISRCLVIATSASPEGHESSYLGVYDLFRLPEKLIVKYNFVEDENEWDYPGLKDYNVLVVAEETDRPDFIESLVSGLGILSTVAEKTKW
ncbi:MAG: hypothetical protein EA381_00245 [Planctomycetaceae bacterium]|nr:MAG: hypothetical protein EA381_00245 [Planctomycetaceae bacterium]